VTRRELLRLGVLGLGGLSLAEVFAGRTAAGTPGTDTAVILLYLHGGPSHLETYDLKPNAPAEYRSIFRPIRTNVPGMDLCELFPLQARIADRFALVRSLHHDVNIHSDGGIVVLTGKRPAVLDPSSQSKSEHPDFGSVASKLRAARKSRVPSYIAIPQQTYMTRPTYLGLAHAPTVVSDPAPSSGQALPFTLTGGPRLEDRHGLLRRLDELRRQVDASRKTEASDRFREQAFELLTSRQVALAFDLGQEGDRLRDRYGRHRWGQACLLARRLATAGAAVITLFIDTPKSGPEFTNWDDHILNAGRPGHFGGFLKVRLPYLDQALSALIEDIYARGLDRRILVVVMGEFGRTPRLSTNTHGTGRDHWPQAYTALLSGGGLRTGQVVGATNARGEYPKERPYTPQDLLATVYRHLGIDYRQALYDAAGRPVPILAEGEPIAELL
jgi:uncharacterized protein (DUF1501 family)